MKNEKIALITGANKGIGFGIAKELGELGFIVILTSRDREKGYKAMEDLKEYGYDVYFKELDVTDEDSIKEAAGYVKDYFGKLDVLINNAGIFIDNGKNSVDADPKAVRETMETNFFGPFVLCQCLVPLLKKSDDGRIINMASGLGSLEGASPGNFAYSVSKTALNGLTAKMASDLKDCNIKVNSMCPGWVRTDMGGKDAERSIEKGAETAVFLATEKDIPTGRFFRDKKEIPW